ncbi:DUF551 domain-containing protein [Enterobacter sp. R1(2018)]|uniref:DUF551 domain-containing protein n=1 Tax=Enterobacter sp. R1(2018) TaxID=2447891 RepID=UPI000EB00910|nr:DUF551 domain-containing protein [Enterobacter sp. R1(2018)]RKQ38349.1 DUF551 domain-containing protein [Enterobacter sp. R1(2018)]
MSNISNEEIEDQIRILEETAVPGESYAFALRALRELLALREVVNIAERLVDRYIANKGSQSEFISCVTPGRYSIGTGGVWDDWKALDSAVNACRAAMLQGADGNSPVIPDGWVVCSERMPDANGEYYLTHSNAGVDVTYFDEGRFFDKYATHWMPLPAAPQAK